MLGISSTNTKYNIQLSSADLISCHRINQVFMCDSFGVMSRRFNDTCLGALYMKKFRVVKDLCRFKGGAHERTSISSEEGPLFGLRSRTS
jgi:hypothetical protein